MQISLGLHRRGHGFTRLQGLRSRLGSSLCCACLALSVSACSPALDWRDARLASAGLSMLLPCKPQVQDRSVEVQGQPWSATLMACDAAGMTFAALALTGFASLAQAQDYPTKTIRIIAPFPTGTGPDANTREIAAELTKVLGQTVVVKDRVAVAVEATIFGLTVFPSSVHPQSSSTADS